MKVGVIRNPVSGGGRMRARWQELENRLRLRFPDIVFHDTLKPGHASELAHALAGSGCQLVIAIGGDGTMGEVADGLMRYDGIKPEFAVISTGTGSDFARNFKSGKSPLHMVDAIANSSPRPLDIGKVTYHNHAGAAEARHFINISSLGISGDIARSVNAVKAFGKASGKLMFKYHTIRELLRYAFRNVSIRLDDQPAFEARIAVVVIANAPWFGGGMKIAPNADMGDGLFDVLVFRAASRLRLIWDLNSVYSGAHLTNRLVSVHRARTVDVSQLPGQGMGQALLDVDGEAPGTLPARYEIIPNALSVRADFI